MSASYGLALAALKYADEMLNQAISVTVEIRKERGLGEFDVSRDSDVFCALQDARNAIGAVLQAWPPRD